MSTIIRVDNTYNKQGLHNVKKTFIYGGVLCYNFMYGNS